MTAPNDLPERYYMRRVTDDWRVVMNAYKGEVVRSRTRMSDEDVIYVQESVEGHKCKDCQIKFVASYLNGAWTGDNLLVSFCPYCGGESEAFHSENPDQFLDISSSL